MTISAAAMGKIRKAAGTNGGFKALLSMGFGLWMDYDWRKHGWDAADAAKNYFTPQQFEASLRSALDKCDEYVWVYTEEPKWWAKPGGNPHEHPGVGRRTDVGVLSGWRRRAGSCLTASRRW